MSSFGPATAATDYEPIGDELYDRTARWLINENSRMPGEPNMLQEWLYDNTSWYEYRIFTLDFADPMSWADEFHEDPRYRQLMWQIEGLEYLLDAGDSSGFQVTPEWQRRETLAATGGSPADYSLLLWRTGFMREVAQEKATEEGEREIALLLELADQAIALDPDNSYFYYKKADVLASLGELDQAWDLLRTGNSVPLNYVPLPFPRTVLLTQLNESSPPSNRTAAALAWLLLEHDRAYEGIRMKLRYKEIDLAIALGYPIELADDYIKRAKRAVQMENQTAAGQALATIACGSMMNYIVEYGILELSPGQQAEYDRLIQLYEYAQQSIEPYLDEWGGIFWSFPETYVSPVIPLPGVKVTPRVWDLILNDCQDAARVRLEINILDPPPFAIWARGELVGVDTSEISNEEGVAADSPGG